MLQEIVKNKLSELKNICLMLSVKRLYVFGSVVSDRFNAESDMDFLISFSENLTVEEYTNNYFTLQYKLRDLFKRNIDLVTERTLSNPYFIESINESKQLIYEA